MELDGQVCDVCGTGSLDIYRCSRCRRRFYCSRYCQKSDWISHKQFCKDTEQKNVKFSEARTSESQPKTALLSKCSFCSVQTKPMACGRCKTANYCSKRCQKLHWPKHKQSCKPTANEPIKQVNDHKEVAEDSAAICLNCAAPSSTRRCTGCYVARYCSKRCQEQDWPRHKLTCNRTMTGSKENTETNMGPSKASAEKIDTPLKEMDSRERISSNSGICQTCGFSGPVKTCTSCKTTNYCCRDCQKKDWASHKLVCMGGARGAEAEDTIKTKGFKKFEYEEKTARKRDSGNNNHVFFPPFLGLFGPELFMAPHRVCAKRPPGSLERARAIATRKYPGRKIIDDFSEVPDEFFRLFGVSNTVLVAFVFRYHEHLPRHGVYLKDKNNTETHVEFYLDFDNPLPFFSYRDVKPGNYICLENACIHHFLDGATGIRIDDPSHVHVIVM